MINLKNNKEDLLILIEYSYLISNLNNNNNKKYENVDAANKDIKKVKINNFSITFTQIDPDQMEKTKVLLSSEEIKISGYLKF